jgi:iron complex outermembrane receptor protein
MKHSGMLPAAVASLLLSSAMDCALAQTAPIGPAPAAEAETVSGEIVVTAQKRAQTLSDVPISVTALTGAQLVEKGINDVQDLVKVTPGLSVANTARGVPVISLRGIGFFEQAIGGRPTVSIYSDEAPLPFSITARAAAFDLERVEVLKGPQGTLFGQSATGGAINYIAAKPTSDFNAGLIASYGRFDTVDAQGHISGPLTQTLSARLAVRSQTSGDWQRSYTRDDTHGSQRFLQGRLLLDWKPTEDFSVLVNVNGFRDRSDNQIQQFYGAYKSRPFTPLLLTYPLAPSDPRAADWNPNIDFRRKNDFYQGVVRATYDLSDAISLTSLTSYSHMDVDTWDSDGTTLNNFDLRDTGYVETLSQELRLSGNLGALTYIVGGNYQRDRTFEILDTFTGYATITPVAGDDNAAIGRQRFSTVAAFADGTFSISDQIRINAGVRYTRQKLDYSGCLAVYNQNSANIYTATINGIRAGAGRGPIPTLAVGQCASLDANYDPAEAFGTLDEDNVSWRAGVDFKPTPRTLIYFNVSRGYKAGSIPTPGASSIEQFRPVRQESVLAYEAGIKTSLFNRTVDLNGAAFYYDYTDKQLLGRNVFTPNIFGAQAALVNIPESRIYGAEAQLVLRPVSGLTIGAAATYLDTKVEGTFVNYTLLGDRTDFAGSLFPYTPRWQLVFDGDYRIPVSSSLMGTLGWNANYRTKTVSGFGSDPRLDIDAYWLLDLRVGVEDNDGKWKASIYGRNVFNEYYWTNVAAGGDALRRSVGMPATYGVQIGFNF